MHYFLLGTLQRFVEWMTRRRRCWFILRVGIIVMTSGSHLIVNGWDHMDGNTCSVRPKMKRFEDNFHVNHFYWLISWNRKIDWVLAAWIINSWPDRKRVNQVKLRIVAKIIFMKTLVTCLAPGFNSDKNRSYLYPVRHQTHCSGHLML